MRSALIAAALVALVVGAALAALQALLDPRILLSPVEARAADAGLTLTVRGEARIGALWRPALELDGFELRDADGETALAAEAVRAELDLIDLLTGEARLDSLRVGNATMPLDAARLAGLDGLAPRGVETVYIAHGVFSASGREIEVRELRLHTDPERGARLAGFLGPEGGVRIEASLAPENPQGMQSATLSLARRGSAEAPPHFAFQANLGGADDGWLIDDAHVMVPGLELAGDGVLRTGERWYASLGLRAENGNLDGLDSSGLMRAVDLASRLGKVELLLRLDRARWRGGTVSDLQADLVVDDGAAEIPALVATLPGQTTLSLSGKASAMAGPGAALAGTALADTGDPDALLSWLGAPTPWKPDAVPRHAVLDVGYRLDADALALDPLTARWNGTTIKGRLSAGRDQPRLEAALDVDSIDLMAFHRPAWLLQIGRAHV